MLLKKLLNFKNRKIWVFQNTNFSYFEKVESEKCHIFSWEYATYYWLIKEYKKNSENNARRLFFKQKSILLKNIKAKNRLNLE